MIKAQCYSDDHSFIVTFDATEWFEHATKQQIRKLANIGFGGGYESDNVCDFLEKTNSRIQRLKRYIQFQQYIHLMGYESAK